MAIMRAVLFLGTVITLAFTSFTANADYTADFKTSSPRGGGAGSMTGKVFFKQKKVRMDMNMPHGRMSVITGGDSGNKVKMIDHTRRTVMTVDGSAGGAPEMPRCDISSFLKCMRDLGYREVGNESVDGHPCKILEKTERPEGGTPVVIRMWHPTDMKEVGFLRMEGKDVSSGTVQYRMDISNVRHGSLGNDTFAAPSGYSASAAPAMPPGMPSAAEMQGKSKEEIMRMMKERMGKGPGH